MARRRQQEALTSHEWPSEFADPQAWATPRERSEAIHAWAREHHPSPRWPGFIDQHWMNASGLRRIEQQADRTAHREALGMGETP